MGRCGSRPLTPVSACPAQGPPRGRSLRPLSWARGAVPNPCTARAAPPLPGGVLVLTHHSVTCHEVPQALRGRRFNSSNVLSGRGVSVTLPPGSLGLQGDVGTVCAHRLSHGAVPTACLPSGALRGPRGPLLRSGCLSGGTSLVSPTWLPAVSEAAMTQSRAWGPRRGHVGTRVTPATARDCEQ